MSQLIHKMQQNYWLCPRPHWRSLHHSPDLLAGSGDGRGRKKDKNGRCQRHLGSGYQLRTPLLPNGCSTGLHKRPWHCFCTRGSYPLSNKSIRDVKYMVILYLSKNSNILQLLGISATRFPTVSFLLVPTFLQSLFP